LTLAPPSTLLLSARYLTPIPHPSHPFSIIVGNSSTLLVTSAGDSVLPGPFYLNASLLPLMIQNLPLVRLFTTNNHCSMEFDPWGLTIRHLTTRVVLTRCDNSGPLYSICSPAPAPSTCVAPPYAATASTWHRRLGHPDHDILSRLSSALAILVPRGNTAFPCHARQLGRHTRLPFTSSTFRTARSFDLIHCDLWTSLILSLSGNQYYLVILDDFSHYLWTFPLRRKSDTFPTLSHFFAWVLTQFHCTIWVVQCDNGREFDNSTSRAFLSRGVQQRISYPYTFPQNDKDEHMSCTITNLICTLLFLVSFLACYWADGLHTATYLLNYLPSKAFSHLTPFTLFGTAPSCSYLRIFRCTYYPNTSATTPHKLAPRSTRRFLLGYSSDHKGYRCLDLLTNRIIISRHVVFDEDISSCRLIPTS
jgi:hypothetical protein